jgi:hypothetical protein
MTAEYKPGDLAMVNNRHDESDWKVGVCVGGGPIGDARWMLPDGMTVWGSVTEVRPLVVIDPEDREQVERLLEDWWQRGGFGNGAEGHDNMQAALREFADPKPPKPVEPLGLGAVVEDVEGLLWVRAGDDEPEWRNDAMGAWKSYADVAVARVLSEGVS